MLCDTAIELLRDLQRDSILPPYDVSDVTRVRSLRCCVRVPSGVVLSSWS